ncbi:hypothetical protein G6011_10548 [Alternaria panax]|uniref:Uncharacterized protein n=1 Tax=Alternaria panax TaxID=48097 RepID=A0AAD4NQV2_9PLEO|nr:hypothetical protein G6011_10548 [Alternaria panax]
MCDSTFTFGQRGSHFFQCPSRREHARLPRKLARFLSSSQLKRIYHVTLGFEDSFLLTWRDTDGKDHIESSGLSPELVDFLYAGNRDIPNVRCTLGPYNSSFFVHDKASYLWKNLPGALLVALQNNIQDGSWTDRPLLVALGAGDNFLLITEKNASMWDLRHYKSAVALLEKSVMSSIHSLTLHAYRYQSFVMQTQSGKLFFENVPQHQIVGIQAMTAPILQDTKNLQRRALASKESDKRESVQKRPSALQQRAQIRREWSEHRQEFTAQAKGVKLSFSLNVSLGGLARMLG